jgi:hypothetical protein
MVPQQQRDQMKIGKRTLAILTVIISLFALCGRSQAVCVSHQAELTDALNGAKGLLESELFARTNGTPTAQQTREAKAIARALATLSLPATNTSQNYGLFLKAATQLGPLALQGAIGLAGSNVFSAFTNQAQAEVDCTAERVGALGEFNRSKRPASNQLAQAQRILNSIASANPQVALLLGRQIYLKIVLANKLAAIGEAHPGFAPDGVAGKTLTHTERGNSGTVQFINDTEANEESENDPLHMSTYMYDRNGLNTAVLSLTSPGDGGGEDVTIAKLKFLSSTNGTFTFRFEDADGSSGSGSGRFSLTP